MKKNFFSMVLAGAMTVCYLFVPASASLATAPDISGALKQNITDYVNTQLKDVYADYYDVLSIESTISDVTVENNKLVAEVNTSLTKMLKAETPYDLPYIQGLKYGLMDLNGIERQEAEAYLATWVEELNTLYIGKKQEDTNTFRVEFPMSALVSRAPVPFELSICDDFGNTYSVEDFSPDTAEEMQEAGVEDINEIAENAQTPQISLMGNARQYDRLAARNYAQRWVYQYADGGSYPQYYNKDYPYYPGNDCANFVSQAIAAGGVTTDNTWQSGSYAWINVNGLYSYMVNNGIFFRSNNRYKAFAGSIMAFTNQQHCGLVTLNDTVTMKFCAHTNDRWDKSFVGYTNVTFYIPVWDSYAGQWTPQ